MADYIATRGFKAPKPPFKVKSQVQDDSIQGTNSSSIVSKRSVERLFFPNEPQYFRHFVKKPQRRSPLINRGYWLRMKAVDHVVKQFLEAPSSKEKVVINLGCGYDPLPWQCLHRYSKASQNVKFVDIDYRDLMLKKREVVKSTEELLVDFTNVVDTLDGNVLFRSDQYVQLGCDLRDLSQLEQTLARVIDIERSSILFTAEVSITYMTANASDALIEWASKFNEARFCLLEQILPEGIHHPFAATMTAHFEKLKTPLGAFQKYPTTASQEKRFEARGWKNVSARNLWELWSAPDFLTRADRLSLDIEPFDEWEEFAIFGCHYFLLVADNVKMKDQLQQPVPKSSARSVQASDSAQFEVSLGYAENPKGLGLRRFGATFSLKSSATSADAMGFFGGMGATSRMSTCDVYSIKETDGMIVGSSPGPSARMCHTITEMGDSGALLVGGRTGPDNSLADTWLYHKWLNTWERVQDVPQPRYRHSAVFLGHGCVLVSPGRTNSKEIGSDFFVWSRKLGWRTCNLNDAPSAVYGATFFVNDDYVSSVSRRGLLAGGISEDAILEQRAWEWEITGFTSQTPTVNFKLSHSTTSGIARFGATATLHKGQIYLVGGIVKDELLSCANEVCIFAADDWTETNLSTCAVVSSALPRPLLVGMSVISTDHSLLIVGGSAVCFSFGTYWNKGSFTLNIHSCIQKNGAEAYHSTWKLLGTIDTSVSHGSGTTQRSPAAYMKDQPVQLSRTKIQSAADFESILRSSKPVILEGLSLGQCTEKWSTAYLKDQIGIDRQVVVHEASSEHMNFQAKNFAYATKLFGDFIDQAESGSKLYLRSLSTEKPSEVPADLTKDFSTLSKDFQLPPELDIIWKNFHSSVLRISGPVIMWLHYDVMANVLVQVRGSKRLLLFPPKDVAHLDFEPGASSSGINVFEKIPPGTHPHEAQLNPGDVLFLPPLWLHTASPTSGMSVAVNVFFRNMRSMYSIGKDVYGNRDLQVYEKGRQDIAKIIKSFENTHADIRDFYLQRLADEFQRKAS